jgi:hypothetical protein
MKTRITAVLALLVVALSLAAAASAAPRQSGIRSWSHQAPAGSKTWDANRPVTVKPRAVKTWSIKAWTIKVW